MSEDGGKVTAEAWPFVTGGPGAPLQAIGLQWSGSASSAPRMASVEGVEQQISWSSGGQDAPPWAEAQRGPRTRRSSWTAAPSWAQIFVPFNETSRRVAITIAGSDQPELQLLVEPPVPWELYLVPHSHVDIGFTEHQDILTDAHGDYIAQALDIMSASDGRPDEEQYRWTCEASWTVEQFLRRHPHREEEFARRLREGRMELTALYCNVTDLFGPEMLERSVLDAVRLRDRYSVPLTSACNYDLNGFGWSLAGVLARAGVRYLDTAINETRSRGVRPRPTLFRWADPQGDEVLLWHSSGYLMGNTLGLHGSSVDSVPRVAAYLNNLRHDGYPHSSVQLLLSGHYGDSMPPTADVCDVVAAWNRTWSIPHLRLATVRDWFEHIERSWPRDVTRYQRAWPDWWADGNGSALYESALVRETQARLTGLDAQRAVASEAGIDLRRLDVTYDTAWRRAMLFCEHTWGSYESAIDPNSPASRGQWHSKAGNAYAAAALADAIESEQMTAMATNGTVSARASGLTNATLQGPPTGYMAGSGAAAVLVFNPVGWRRSEVVAVHIPGHLSAGEPPKLRDARTGEEVSAVVRRYEAEDVVNRQNFTVSFLAVDLPANAHAVFWIEPGGTLASLTPADDGIASLDTSRFSLELDTMTGGVRSLVHKPSGCQVVQQLADCFLNTAIYERVDRNAVATWEGLPASPPEFERVTMVAHHITASANSPFGPALQVRASEPHGLAMSTEIRIPEHADYLEIVNTLEKPPVPTGEALYQAFPLGRGGGQIYLDVPGGPVRPGLDQVPGTATDWHSVQDWFAVDDGDITFVVATPDVPLVQCTGINTGMWREEVPPTNGVIMSWVLNNYWFTNFPAQQSGRIRYRYRLAVQEGPFDAARVARVGTEARHRPWARAVRLASSEADLFRLSASPAVHGRRAGSRPSSR